MKASGHPNIVNFFDLWVVMEYMEGGALTDMTENNTLAKNLLSCVCFEPLKITDSRSCAQLTDTKSKHATMVDIPYWMAPEAMNENEVRYLGEKLLKKLKALSEKLKGFLVLLDQEFLRKSSAL
ncbi:Pkinase-domain-containing protein [Flagelloscypha sp. PMI_526]|nr:Pkinase-domain-containing protein [Flagelloscypha sp. PMI_526]